MAGYLNQPELTAQMLVDGPVPGEKMLCTQDQFTVDEDGFLYFVGRTDDIIKSGGQKVSPSEIENILHSIPGVRDAVVVGMPDETLGEAVRAYIVLHTGSTLTDRDVIRACRERLEPLLVPRAVEFVETLPTTDSGKVRRKDLTTR
jgi:acyl-coenzyme A synthetase/AMP-(fatty) acid ligase